MTFLYYWATYVAVDNIKCAYVPDIIVRFEPNGVFPTDLNESRQYEI